MIEKLVALNRLRKLFTHERENVADLSSRLDQVSALLAVAKAMNSELGLREVLGVILESAVDMLEATGGAIMLVDGPSHLKAVCTMSNDTARGVGVPIGQGLAGRVALTREPLVVNGPFDHVAFAVSAERNSPAESAMFVALVSRDQLLGVLNIFSRDREFSSEDLRPLMLFAEHAALSIVNSRLYETERRIVSELRELNRSG